MEVVTQQKAEAIRLIAIQDVLVPKNYTRKLKKKDQSIQELADNIKSMGGVINAIIVRLHPKHATDGKFELISGYRRLTASTLAGFNHIKAEVVKVDDRMAGIINVTENLQREDLSPLEEAESLKKLIEAGKDTKEISESLGKTESWVVRRSKLLSLIPEWRAVMNGVEKITVNDFERDNPFRGWSVGHYELFARYPKDEQLVLYLEFGDDWEAYEWTVKDIEKALNDRMTLISKAPWKLDDESLHPDAGSCTKCSKRSGHQAILFQDDLSPEAIEKNDKCLDRECWEKKTAAYLDGRIATLKEKHPKLIKISNSGMTSGNDDVLPSWDWDKAKKGDKKAVPAIVVNGPGLGELQYIKPNSRGLSSSATKKAINKNMDPEAKLKAKKEQRKKRVYAQILTEIRSKLYNMSTDDDSGEVQCSQPVQILRDLHAGEKMMALAAIFGTQNNLAELNDEDSWKEFEKTSPFSKEEVIQKLWESMIGVFADRLKYHKPSDIFDCQIKDAKRICQLINLDFKELERAAEASVPVPKSWAKEEAAIKLQKKQKRKKAKTSKKKASKKKKSAGRGWGAALKNKTV